MAQPFLLAAAHCVQEGVVRASLVNLLLSGLHRQKMRDQAGWAARIKRKRRWAQKTGPALSRSPPTQEGRNTAGRPGS